MGNDVWHLMLDSLAIGVAAATMLLASILLLDADGTGRVLAGLGYGTLTLIWIYFAVASAPFGTLFLLWRMGRD